MDARSFLMGSGNPGFSFNHPQDRMVGQIVGEPTVQQQKVFGTNDPAFWPSGDPKLQLLIPVQTNFRNYEGITSPDRTQPDSGARTVYVKGKHFEPALKRAILDAGASWLEVGGWLDITYTGDDYESKAGVKPKIFTIRYQSPMPGQQAPAAPRAARPVLPPQQPQVPTNSYPQHAGNPWGVQAQPTAPRPPQPAQSDWYVQHAPVGYTDPMPTMQVPLPPHHEQGPPPEWATPVPSAPPVQVSPAPVSPPPAMSTLQAIRANRAELSNGTEDPAF